MKRDDYICELNEVYNRFYKDGRCKYYDKCREGITEKPCKFFSDKANVGAEYGNDPSMPKIVVVGLEGLGKCGEVKEIDFPSDSAYNPHYKGVRYVLAYILSRISGATPPNTSLKSDLKKYAKNTIDRYALLNCYKCAFDNKAQNLPHTDNMKKHCQEILWEEIRVLDPDFIIIQVKNNRPQDFETNLHNGGVYERVSGDENTGVYTLKHQNKKPMIVIWTYHGSSDPDPHIRSWTNDNKKGCRYIKNSLNPILNKAVEVFFAFQKEEK